MALWNMQCLREQSEEELRAPSNQREAERGRERNRLIFLMQKREINTPTHTVKTSPVQRSLSRSTVLLQSCVLLRIFLFIFQNLLSRGHYIN